MDGALLGAGMKNMCEKTRKRGAGQCSMGGASGLQAAAGGRDGGGGGARVPAQAACSRRNYNNIIA
jgi:hypothetical protein